MNTNTMESTMNELESYAKKDGVRRDAALKAWDQVRLVVMDLHFAGAMSTAQVKTIQRIFVEGFTKTAGADLDNLDDMKVARFNLRVLGTKDVGGCGSDGVHFGPDVERDPGLPRIWSDNKPQAWSLAIGFTRKSWEGTLAGLVCANHGHFFIGVRGGIEAKNYREGGKTKAQEHPLIYGWRN